jgi:hypothetical protein
MGNSLATTTTNGSVIAMIPARYEASRFPGKLMQMLRGENCYPSYT